MKSSFEKAVSEYGRLAKAKLGGGGEPEDQLRAPFEGLLSDLADLVNIPRNEVVAVGEARIGDLRTRPDYAIHVHGALVGHVEMKAPGKGANPNRFRDTHDKTQWQKLSSLPNLIYTDGNEFSLWRDGEIVGSVVRLEGDIESAGSKLAAPLTLPGLFESFLRWTPSPPRNVRELAHTSARLCRLLRDEANDRTFADGYSQAVTFGLLMARAIGGPYTPLATTVDTPRSTVTATVRSFSFFAVGTSTGLPVAWTHSRSSSANARAQRRRPRLRRRGGLRTGGTASSNNNATRHSARSRRTESRPTPRRIATPMRPRCRSRFCTRGGCWGSNEDAPASRLAGAACLGCGLRFTDSQERLCVCSEQGSVDGEIGAATVEFTGPCVEYSDDRSRFHLRGQGILQ